jgi:hypothetical protein
MAAMTYAVLIICIVSPFPAWNRYCACHQRYVLVCGNESGRGEISRLTCASHQGHTLVIPKRHYATLDAMPAEDMAELGRVLPNIAKAVTLGCNTNDYNIMQNNGKQAGQVRKSAATWRDSCQFIYASSCVC